MDYGADLHGNQDLKLDQDLRHFVTKQLVHCSEWDVQGDANALGRVICFFPLLPGKIFCCHFACGIHYTNQAQFNLVMAAATDINTVNNGTVLFKATSLGIFNAMSWWLRMPIAIVKNTTQVTQYIVLHMLPTLSIFNVNQVTDYMGGQISGIIE